MSGSQIGILVAGVLTVCVFTYLLADNPIYRLVEHILVGASLGWVAVMLFQSVLVGRLAIPFRDDPVGNLHLLVPFGLGLLLLSRLLFGPSWVSNGPVGFMVGTGVALAMAGALTGMLIPQILGTARSIVPGQNTGWMDALSNLIVVLGVVATLVSFRYTRPRPGLDSRLTHGLTIVGRYGLMVAFGAYFASLSLSRVTLLAGRIGFLVNDWLKAFS